MLTIQVLKYVKIEPLEFTISLSWKLWRPQTLLCRWQYPALHRIRGCTTQEQRVREFFSLSSASNMKDGDLLRWSFDCFSFSGLWLRLLEKYHSLLKNQNESHVLSDVNRWKTNERQKRCWNSRVESSAFGSDDSMICLPKPVKTSRSHAASLRAF